MRSRDVLEAITREARRLVDRARQGFRIPQFHPIRDRDSIGQSDQGIEKGAAFPGTELASGAEERAFVGSRAGEFRQPDRHRPALEIERRVIVRDIRHSFRPQEAIDPHGRVPGREAEILEATRSPAQGPFRVLRGELHENRLDHPEIEPIVALEEGVEES